MREEYIAVEIIRIKDSLFEIYDVRSKCFDDHLLPIASLIIINNTGISNKEGG